MAMAFGWAGGHGVDGADHHLSRPGKAPEARDARLVDGYDGDVVRGPGRVRAGCISQSRA